MNNNKFKIALTADLHHYSQTLGISGRAYELRSLTDQKCLAETGAIIDSAFDVISRSDADAVLIAGDLTNDGEKASHDEVREKIARLDEKIPVYVVYATHDWCCDGNPRRFDGDDVYHDVETVTPAQLREMYRPFGVDRAYDEYVTDNGSSSYAVKLGGRIRFLGMNDDRNGKGSSGYSDEHLDWILSHVRDAKANGETVIMMQHHLLLDGISPLINKSQHIGDNMKTAEILASAGVDLILVGHSHMQRTTSYTAENGNTLVQINQGSLCGYPAPITYITVEDGKITVDTQHLEQFKYNNHICTQNYLKEHTTAVLDTTLESAVSDKELFFDILKSIGVKLDKVEKYYPVMKKAAEYIMNVNVGTAGRLVNAVTFGQGIDRKALKAVKDDNLLGHIREIFLSVFDGSEKKYGTDDPVYIIVKDIASLPRRFMSHIPVKNSKLTDTLILIEKTAEELTNPSLPDNSHTVIGG